MTLDAPMAFEAALAKARDRSSNTVTLTFWNLTVGSLDPSSTTYNVRVIKK